MVCLHRWYLMELIGKFRHQHISIGWWSHSGRQETIHLDGIVINRRWIITRDCGRGISISGLVAHCCPCYGPHWAPTFPSQGGPPSNRPSGTQKDVWWSPSIHVPLASNHSNSCQRVLLPISILNRKLSTPVQDPLWPTRSQDPLWPVAIITFICSPTMACSLLHRLVVPRGENMALPFMRRFPPGKGHPEPWALPHVGPFWF